MKKLMAIAALILFSGVAYGQTLDKGYIVGFHTFSLHLDPDATFNQYKNFFIQEYIPELDKNFPDIKHYFTEGNRTENKNKIGFIVVFESQEIKDKYYNKDGSQTDLMISIQERIRPTRAELDRLGTVNTEYTEWIIQ
jgi:hypothetical protein